MEQPKALTPLFATELWERFGFYIIQGLLVIFLSQHLDFSDDRAYKILGAYTALIYISPIIGGYIADHILGFRNAILLGAILLCVGYVFTSIAHFQFLLAGLAIVICGNGFLKPNISSFLGEFYKENDTRREAGFTLFYIGINFGILASTLSSGFIQEYFGWHATFACAAIGMLIAIISFILGFKYFKDKGLAPHKNALRKPLYRYLSNRAGLASVIAGMILLPYLLLEFPRYGNIILTICAAALFIVLFVIALRCHKLARRRMVALIILIIASIIFWGLYFQMFFSMNLFIERAVDRHLFGIKIPTVLYISSVAFFIIVLGTPTAFLWKHLHKRKKNPSIPTKFALSMFALAIAMAIFVIAIHLPEQNGLVHSAWIVLAYLFVTVGELLLSPIGLSMVTTLSPPRMTGMLMGAWFFALGMGGALASVFAQEASVPKMVVQISSIENIYDHAFFNYSIYAVIAGAAILALTPWLKRLIAGK